MILKERELSPEAIIEYCANVQADSILGGSENGNRVVKINNNIAVKWGVGVFEQEYLNQLEALRVLEPALVRVPRAHDFYRRFGTRIPCYGCDERCQEREN